MKLTVEIYKISAKLPSDEKYGLTSQIRRAAVSIPSNIAEGSSRASNKDFLRFLSISLGSAFELETQILIAEDLLLLDSDDAKIIIQKLDAIQKMIIGLQQKLDTNHNLLNEDIELYSTSSKF